MDEKQFAWFAGLFEGEGCFQFQGRASVEMQISGQDEDTIRRVRDIVGVGTVRLNHFQKEPHYAKMWVWNAGKKEEVIALINELMPWLSERRRTKAEEALVRLSQNRGIHQPIEHGTRKGFRMEQNREMDPCENCRAAYNKYNREKREARKISANGVGSGNNI